MDQITLPKKIKIAARLMVITGILIFCQFIFTLSLAIYSSGGIKGIGVSTILTGIIFNYSLLAAILFILFAYFIAKSKKWAWFAAIVLLLKEIVAGINILFLFFFNFSNQIDQFAELKTLMPSGIFVLLIISVIFSVILYIFTLISLIFLFQERENYWQIAS
jgi:hypothetical protein